MRIAKAVRDRKWGKVKSLQWMLTHSHHTKLLAVKRVSQSSGAKTPGVDGVLWRTAEQKICAALSLQRRGYKAQPKLSRKSIKTFLDDIHALIKSHPTIKTESLFRLLNPKLRG
jgi:retron-type reverse transcriptase